MNGYAHYDNQYERHCDRYNRFCEIWDRYIPSEDDFEKLAKMYKTDEESILRVYALYVQSVRDKGIDESGKFTDFIEQWMY